MSEPFDYVRKGLGSFHIVDRRRGEFSPVAHAYDLADAEVIVAALNEKVQRAEEVIRNYRDTYPEFADKWKEINK